ncbi:hypothetical protein PG995_014245 [Apiospora arundinis]
MCDYTQVEYSCGHFRFRVQRWCSHYERTHRVCPPNITTGELRGLPTSQTRAMGTHDPTMWPRRPIRLNFPSSFDLLPERTTMH